MTPEGLARTHAAAFAGGEVWNARDFADLLAHPGTFATGTAAAFALLRVTLDEAELLTLACDPARRRQGLARAALDAGEAEARARGARAIYLEVAEDNAPAQALYRAAGYVMAGRRPAYYARAGGAVAALLLRKDLQDFPNNA